MGRCRQHRRCPHPPQPPLPLSLPAAELHVRVHLLWRKQELPPHPVRSLTPRQQADLHPPPVQQLRAAQFVTVPVDSLPLSLPESSATG